MAQISVTIGKSSGNHVRAHKLIYKHTRWYRPYRGDGMTFGECAEMKLIGRVDKKDVVRVNGDRERVVRTMINHKEAVRFAKDYFKVRPFKYPLKKE